MYKFKNDRYRKSRGGNARVLDIICCNCHSHVAYYQKDGPGVLKRMYADRLIDISGNSSKLTCLKCGVILGLQYVYKKENRPAYKLLIGAVDKKVIRADQVQ